MALLKTPRNKLLTVQQFADHFLPTLIHQLRVEIGVAMQEAYQISETIIEKLKVKFQENRPQPVQVFQQAIAIIVDRETRKYRRLLEKNFGLSETAFQEMVLQLQAGDEQLFEQIFLSHFNECMNKLKKLYKASHQDAYDATMNTMLIFCRRLKRGDVKYGNLQYLFTQVATHRYLNWIGRESKTTPFDKFDISEDLPLYDAETYALLHKAFAQLGEGCQDLLNAFYYKERTLQQVAEKTERSYVAVRKQKQRCIEKLRVFFKQLS